MHFLSLCVLSWINAAPTSNKLDSFRDAVTEFISNIKSTSTLPLELDSEKTAIEFTQCKEPGTIALTFDDGPTANVLPLIDKLNDLGVKATFFVNAHNYVDLTDPDSEAPNILRRAYKAGHQIGSHTFSHAKLTLLSNIEIFNEMKKNDDAINAIIGIKPIYMRPPYLDVNSNVLKLLGNLGYTVVHANLDTKDYEFNRQADAVQSMRNRVEQILNLSDPSTNSFIALNHDFVVEIVKWTEAFVTLGRAKGYRFVTMSECINDFNPYRH